VPSERRRMELHPDDETLTPAQEQAKVTA
jgi:hypothetical protein